MNPRTMALRYRIWAHAAPRGWNCTAAEIAEALGETQQRVSRALVVAKWNSRVRVGSIARGPDNSYRRDVGSSSDVDGTISAGRAIAAELMRRGYRLEHDE
jgi:hypothetical protein